MSICTKTGDSGLTGLMYNRRAQKTDSRVEACGAIDEVNAAIGMARAVLGNPTFGSLLLQIQKDLVDLMGELATLPGDLEKYRKDGYKIITADMGEGLEKLIKELEQQKLSFKGWATPGANSQAAALDFARTVARRAERRVWGLIEESKCNNQAIAIYLNRLSDLLWLMARKEESAES